jgi:hypothetical protein
MSTLPTVRVFISERDLARRSIAGGRSACADAGIHPEDRELFVANEIADAAAVFLKPNRNWAILMSPATSVVGRG